MSECGKMWIRITLNTVTFFFFVLEMDWKNFEKDRKSFDTVLKIWQNNTCRLAAFLETLHAAIIFRRLPCILGKMANSSRVSFTDIQKWFNWKTFRSSQWDVLLKCWKNLWKMSRMKLAPSQAEQLPKRSSPVDTSTIELVCIFAPIHYF